MALSHGYAALARNACVEPFEFERRSLGSNDIAASILFCGICHSDLHAIDNDWGFHSYPLVPGHEIIARVTAIGPGVEKFSIGDVVGIGTVIDSCRTCEPCSQGEEIYCETGATPTFGGADRLGTMTYGGFSNDYVVDEHFAVMIPPMLDPAHAAPLLCAGITTYSPLRRANLQSGHKVGIVGMGGLGHLAVKWARAWGAQVVVFTTTAAKAADALRFGADLTVVSSDLEQMARHSGSFHYILDTVSAPHDPTPYLGLLKLDGTLCMIGMPAEPLSISSMMLAWRRLIVTSSMTGGIAETQEMLDFAAAHGIKPEIERVGRSQINEALDRLRKNDVRYRFVIDMGADCVDHP